MFEDVLAVQQDLAFDAGVANGFVHAVQGAQEGRFAAAGGSDEGGDLVLAKIRSRCCAGPERYRSRN